MKTKKKAFSMKMRVFLLLISGVIAVFLFSRETILKKWGINLPR